MLSLFKHGSSAVLLFLGMVAFLFVLVTRMPAQEKGDSSAKNPPTLLNQEDEGIPLEKRVAPQPSRLPRLPGARRSESNKLWIIGPDGKKQELDTSGSASVVLKQSVQTVTENGEQQVRVQGKAVVIGPDGKQTEYDLAEPVEPALGKLDWGMPEDLPARLQKMLEDFPVGPDRHNLFGPAEQILPGRLRQRQPSVEKYTVGLQCRPVLDSTLRYQLNLDEQVGLIVVRVSENSPGFAAGIQPHDILLYADQASLSSVSDLREAVHKAGEEGLPLSLNFLSQGKEKGVEVQPVESRARPDNPAAAAIPGFEQQKKQMLQQMQQEMLRMREQLRQFEQQSDGRELPFDNH
ncbi:MAG: PDZ domain-containing protein [Planctomycetota bacterium]|nr:PDZ domain-containing protein [Planctomycetota bacterium]